jgi:hypothetical protein
LIIPPFFELGSIRSILINFAVFESRHGKQRYVRPEKSGATIMRGRIVTVRATHLHAQNQRSKGEAVASFVKMKRETFFRTVAFVLGRTNRCGDWPLCQKIKERNDKRYAFNVRTLRFTRFRMLCGHSSSSLMPPILGANQL